MLRQALFVAVAAISARTVVQRLNPAFTLAGMPRDQAPGAFAALSQGDTHYRLSGPADKQDAPLVVTIHGFSGNHHAYDAFREGMADRFRVLQFDLYGRGYSDSPPCQMTPGLFSAQLAELLWTLGEDGPVHVVGWSMGGAIAAHFATTHPSRVRSLALVAPAGLRAHKPPTAHIVTLPVIGELGMQALGGATSATNFEKEWEDPTHNPHLLAEGLAHVHRHFDQNAGLRRALVSTLRHFPLDGMHDTFARLKGQPFPITVVHGRDDITIPFEAAQDIQALVPEAVVVKVPGRHCAFLERQEECREAIVENIGRSVVVV